MSKKLRNLSYRMGHRGTFLLFISLFDFLFAFSLYEEPGAAAGLQFIFPLHAWALVWVACGVIILSGVFAKRDYIQFTVATFIKIVWSALYIHAWLFESFPRGWVNALIWAMFAILVVIISSWPEVRSFKLSATVTGKYTPSGDTDPEIPSVEVRDGDE